MGYCQSKISFSDNALKRKEEGHGVKIHCFMGRSMEKSLVSPKKVHYFDVLK